ncbi:MAG: cupin domain-containing protein [Bryobacteraceae bacterium]|jgi:anti-sigma factor ChrR (cupin superfamily)
MIEHPTANDEIRHLASLFAAGALPPGEEAEFQEHVASCGVCAEEARPFREAAGWMPFAYEGTDAPPHLREKLLARIQQSAPPPGFRIVRAAEGDWRTLLPGITAKRLYEESTAGNLALLVRMEPGAKYPPHSHAAVEHCYVLRGDLHFGDLVLHPGDYQCAMASTEHRDSHTVEGCLLLIVASQQNAMLPWTR